MGDAKFLKHSMGMIYSVMLNYRCFSQIHIHLRMAVEKIYSTGLCFRKIPLRIFRSEK